MLHVPDIVPIDIVGIFFKKKNMSKLV